MNKLNLIQSSRQVRGIFNSTIGQHILRLNRKSLAPSTRFLYSSQIQKVACSSSKLEKSNDVFKRIESDPKLVDRNSKSSSNESNKENTAKFRRLKLLLALGLSVWLIDRFYLSKQEDAYIRLYKKLPLRSLSRAWGKLNAIELPVWFRSPIYKFYSWLFSCNLNEMDIEDLTHYKNLSEFFRRSLKPTARSIDSDCCLISPCDGKILNFGRVDNGLLEQVKGVNYSLKGFLGLQNWPKNQTNGNGQHALKDIKSESMADMQSLYEKIEDDNALYEKSVLYNKNNRLYHCVIYLAPGDYHRFHSPTDWTIFYRRHFPGELFSVNPSVARWLQGLFNLNERVVYYGQWKHGFFSMSPVGATNVGSISVFMDEKLTTNNKKLELDNYNDLDKSFSYRNETGLHGVNMKRGDLFGEFNLGSTIVLIFEAPDNFEFSSSPCDKVFFGQQLGSATSKFHEQKS